jgi:phage repressor protein C with HTH and peptisase S24 domain
MNTLAKRILALRGSKPQSEFSALLGVAQNSLGRYERGERTPDADFLSTLVERLGVSSDWLLRGVGPAYDPTRTRVEEFACGSPCGTPLAQVVVTDPIPPCDVDMVYVPMVEARLSAGTGSFETSGEAEKRYGFRSDFLSRKGQPSQMVLMRVDGDSMEPEIHHGDVVLIDQSQTTPRAGAMFAVGVEDLVYIKMVDTLPGKIILKSCNESFPPLEIDARGDLVDGIRIVGKAVWLGRELR